jgi:hypothetical protein
MAHRHSAATRKKISDVRRQQFLRQAKERQLGLEPTAKRCPRCQITKPVEEFGSRKFETKAGLISVTPRTACRSCEAARARQWKKEKIAEGTWEKYKKRKEAGRDPSRRREYQREYAAMRRRKEGVKPMNWRKKPKAPKERRASMDLPVEPISVLLEVLEAQGLSREEIGDRSGVEVRRLYEIAHLATPSTRIDNVDKLLMAFGRQDELNDLYPLEEEERLVGYRLLDPEGKLEAVELGSIHPAPPDPRIAAISSGG